MSVIQTLRGRFSTLALVILIIALVGFLLMDAVQSNISKVFQEDRTMMGEVNGERIETQLYQQRLQELEDYRKQQSGNTNLTDEEREGLQQQLWGQLLNEKLLNAEMEKLGLEVTKKEFQDMMTNQQFADDAVKQNFTDPNTGIFDANKVVQYEQQIAQSKDQAQRTQWEKFKDGLAQNRQITKYTTMIRNGIYVPSFVLDEMASQQNKSVSISYVLAPYTSVNDADIKVSDDEIKAFMKERESVYTNQEDKAAMDYVVFSIVPSSEDTATSLGYLNKLNAEFLTAADAAQFASDNSDELVDDAFYNINTLANENKAALIDPAVGSFVGPYYDNKAYKISKVAEKKQMPDSVKASRIFIAFTEQRNEAQAKSIADSLEKQINGGASFAALAAQRSDDQGTATKGGDMGYVTKDMVEPAVAKEIFNGQTGQLKVIKTGSGYQLLKINDQKDFKTNVKLTTIAKSMVASEKTMQLAFTKGQKFKNDAKDEASFNSQVKKLGMDKRIAQDIAKTQSIVPGLGNVRSLVRWAYESKIGDISSVMNFDDKCVVARLTSRTKKGELGDMNVFRTEIESQIRRKKKAEMLAVKGKGKNNLSALASVFGAEVKTADSISMSMMAPSSIGYEPRVSGAAMNNKLVNKVSEGIAGEQGVYFISVTKVVDNTKTAQRIPQLERMQAQMQYMNSVDQLIPVALQKKAKIVDNRGVFY